MPLVRSHGESADMSSPGLEPDTAAGSPLDHHATTQVDLGRAYGQAEARSVRDATRLTARIQVLEGRLQRSDERLKQTRDALENMRSLRDTATSRNAAFRKQLTALQTSARETAGELRAERAALRERVRAEEASSSVLLAENKALRKAEAGSAVRVGALEGKLQRSEERLEQTRDALERMRSLRDAAASRNAVVREQLTALQTSARETAGELRAERAALRERVRAEEASSSALRAENKTLQKAAGVSAARVGALEGKLQRSEERLEQARGALEKMRSLRDAAASRNAVVREQFTALQSTAREAAGRWKAEGADLRAQAQAEKASSSSLQAEIKALRKAEAASTVRVGALEGKLQRSEERLEQARGALEKMRSLRDAAASRNAVVREQLTALQSTAREAAGRWKAEGADLRAQVQAERASSSSLQAEIKALRKAEAGSTVRVRALEGKLQRSEERLEQARGALEKIRSSRDAAASRNVVVREQFTALQSTAREAAESWKAEGSELRARVQSLQAEIKALQKAEAGSTVRVGALEGKLQRSEQRLEQARGALEKIRSSRDAAASQNVALREQLTALQCRARDAAEKWKAEKSDLRARVHAERASSASLQAEIKALRKAEAASAVRVGALEGKLQRSEQRLEQTRDALKTLRDGAAEKHGVLAERLAVSRERVSSMGSLWNGARRYSPLYRQGLLYDEIAKSDIDLSADTYLCLLPSTVPAAMTLNRMQGGGAKIICDSVENVEVHKHSLAPNLHPPTLDMVNLGAYGALTSVDGIMTVSNAVANTLTRFGPPVRVQPNYRRYEEPAPAGDLRQRLGLDPETTILVTTGNVVKGFDTVIDALALLPPTVHLVALVKMSPPSYEAEMRAHIESKGLSERVHLRGFVPYGELAGVLSDADLGLITLDPANPNHSVSLPNRVFDFTTAGLPFVVPPLAEIAALAEEHGCGAVLPEVSAEAWAATIQHVLVNISDYRDAMRIARKKLTWESFDDGLIEFLGNPKSVTLLGFRDLSRYQRFLRVTDSLTQRGIHVKAVFFSEDPLPVKNSDAEFYHFADRHGRGSGLKRVPTEGD